MSDIISTAGNILAAGMTSYTQSRNVKRMIAAQKAENELAYQRSVEMYERQNDYNSPINVVSRLRDAGLNPNLALGSPTPASNYPTYDPADMSALGSMSDTAAAAIDAGINSRYVNAQIDLLRSQKRKTDSESGLTDVGRRLAEMDARVRDELNNQQLSLGNWTIDNIAAGILESHARTDATWANARQINRNIEYMDDLSDQVRASVRNLDSQTLLNTIDSWTRHNLNSAEISNLNQVTANLGVTYKRLLEQLLHDQVVNPQLELMQQDSMRLLKEQLIKAAKDNNWYDFDKLLSSIKTISTSLASIMYAVGSNKGIDLPSYDEYTDTYDYDPSGTLIPRTSVRRQRRTTR